MDEAGSKGDDAPPMHPVLVEVNPGLRESAAEIQIPVGTYRLVHVVYDPMLWGEEGSWDGHAETRIGFAWTSDGEGTFMHAFGFQPSAGAGDPTIRPFVTFFPFDGEGWVVSWVRSSCSGEGCEDQPPRHEAAFLIGSPTSAVVLRVGVVTAESDADTLWERDALPIRADAETTSAFSGNAYRFSYLGQEHKGAAGVMEADWGGTGLPTSTGVARTSHYETKAEIAEAGVLSLGFYGIETLGVDEWAYSLETAGPSGSWDGAWVHAPQSGQATLTGVLWPPLVGFQGNVPAGPVSFTSDRSFTGQSDPTWLLSYAAEGASIGHAGLDLDALFGWDTSRPLSPDEGGAACTVTSMQPEQMSCVGDRRLAPDHSP